MANPKSIWLRDGLEVSCKNSKYGFAEYKKGSIDFVKITGIEPISMGYVIVEPGMTAGKVGEVDLVKQDDIESAVGYALAAQYLGMDFFYLEAGSGAHSPIPDEMISAVKESIDIPLVVGGGIKDAVTAGNKAKAGADVVVTGTKLEKEKNLKKALSDIINSIEE